MSALYWVCGQVKVTTEKLFIFFGGGGRFFLHKIIFLRVLIYAACTKIIYENCNWLFKNILTFGLVSVFNKGGRD